VCILLALVVANECLAQRDIIRDIGNRVPNAGNRGGAGGQDSLRRRTNAEDSITLRYYIIDSTRAYTLDSSILDFTGRFPIPATHIYLGNTGAATRSLLFERRGKAGFDPGFHAFDVYKFAMEDVRFYNTTRPYTELGYMLASKAEQIIELLHTQNLKPHWNASARYRLINAPGYFKNQKTYHNNYQVTSWYQSPNKRYNNYVVLLKNKLQLQESGGIMEDTNYLDLPAYSERFIIPSKLGGSPPYGRDFFRFQLTTGNRYTESNILLRQQYDLGKKDSVVTDSTVIPLFYPRLRFEHSLRYGSYQYEFYDQVADSQYYAGNYGILLPRPSDTISFKDGWRELSNDLSIYQFPDAKNLHQFLRAGIEYQVLNGTVRGNINLHNLVVHGEYRNRTRNQKWDMLGFGRFWVNGYNAGDYHGFASLQRSLGAKLGSLQLGFENVNRSPSFIYNQSSRFYFDAPRPFDKENTLHLFVRLSNAALRLQLGADYYLVSNYLYLAGFRQLKQESALFNLLRINALKSFRLTRHWNWHAEVYLQQKAGNVQLNVPALYTRNRISYDGNFGFRNLNFSGGLEVRYHTPYKADDYSPVLGQFFFQDSVTLNNRPDVHAFVHFRIRSFRAYLRAENLNTARVLNGSFGFTKNNLAAPGYPNPELLIRVGIYWSFVN